MQSEDFSSGEVSDLFQSGLADTATEETDPSKENAAVYFKQSEYDLGMTPVDYDAASTDWQDAMVHFVYIGNTTGKKLHISKVTMNSFELVDYYHNPTEIHEENDTRLAIIPKAGLAPGKYAETMELETAEGYRASVVLKFVVGPSVDEPYAIDVGQDEYHFTYDLRDEDDDHLDDGDEDEGWFIGVSNLGTKTVYLDTSHMEFFHVAVDGFDGELKPGQEAALELFMPSKAKEPGNYERSIDFVDENKVVRKQIKFYFTVTGARKLVELDTYKLKTGKTYLGKTDLTKQTVSLTNCSDIAYTMAWSYKKGTDEGLELVGLTDTQVMPGQTITFTVQPKAGTKSGRYNTKFHIYPVGYPEDFQLLETEVRVIPVLEEILDEEIDPPVQRNGIDNNDLDYGIPSLANILKTSDGDLVQARIKWDTENVNYDKDKKEEQKFKMTGTVIVPDSLPNPQKLTRTFTTEVTVRAREPMAKPVISNCRVMVNKLFVSLMGYVEDADKYEFVIGTEKDFIQTKKFVSKVTIDNNTGIAGRNEAVIPYLARGTYYVSCRGYAVKDGKKSYTAWADIQTAEVTAKNPGVPTVKKVQVTGNTVRVTLGNVASADGYICMLNKDFKNISPEEPRGIYYEQSKTASVVFQSVSKGTYKLGVAAYNNEGSNRAYTNWSPLKTVKVTAAAPSMMTIKKRSVSGRNLTVSLTLPKGIKGYDIVLGKSSKNTGYHRNEVFNIKIPTNIAYKKTAQTASKVTFKNLKKGTYYLNARCYTLKNGKKIYSLWNKMYKVVIK